MSHHHILDTLKERVTSLAQSGPESPAVRRVDDVTQQYEALCEQSKELLTRLEQNVFTHQRYRDGAQQLQDWMAVYEDKLSSCADCTGDRYAIQNKLDRLQVRRHCDNQSLS